ncbi:MAG: 2-hydroxy-3-oxopropionate reductase [Chloroflexi bacterium]|nr:2-hydroxy-3-oxopropionate reductase [Chloroflexota bacterium]MCH8234788.1 2-hydroxy-3-oxopropionate reductase [Chloroflexota bacterium]MCH8818361.1 2-hydroxy-3-oxopropionate reductase [Chloroflexota bacterium]
MADEKRIGIIGLGIMGKPMARNLMTAGYEVAVYDLFPEPVEELVTDGAILATSPADVASKSDLTVIMVQNSPQSMTAILGEDGVVVGADKGQLVVDMSSIAPLISQQIGKELDAAGIDFLDAPVSGGEPGAVAGTLAIMVGGTRAAFDRAAPIFDATGASAVLCGPVGAGGFTKLANQICVAANINGLAEALVLTSKAGLDPETVFNAIKGGLAGSNVMNAKAPMMFARNFQAGFRIELHLKDMNNVMDTAQQMGVPLQMSAQLQQVLQALCNEGNGTDDHAGILKYVEALAKVEVKK